MRIKLFAHRWVDNNFVVYLPTLNLFCVLNVSDFLEFFSPVGETLFLCTSLLHGLTDGLSSLVEILITLIGVTIVIDVCIFFTDRIHTFGSDTSLLRFGWCSSLLLFLLLHLLRLDGETTTLGLGFLFTLILRSFTLIGHLNRCNLGIGTELCNLFAGCITDVGRTSILLFYTNLILGSSSSLFGLNFLEFFYLFSCELSFISTHGSCSLATSTNWLQNFLGSLTNWVGVHEVGSLVKSTLDFTLQTLYQFKITEELIPFYRLFKPRKLVCENGFLTGLDVEQTLISFNKSGKLFDTHLVSFSQFGESTRLSHENHLTRTFLIIVMLFLFLRRLLLHLDFLGFFSPFSRDR